MESDRERERERRERERERGLVIDEIVRIS